MTTYDLMLKVKKILEDKGFETKSPKVADGEDFSFQGSARKDNKAIDKPVEGYNFTHLYGYTINFSVVSRRNATAQNISVDIDITHWTESCGKIEASARINVKMSDKSIEKRVNKIIDIYEAI